MEPMPFPVSEEKVRHYLNQLRIQMVKPMVVKNFFGMLSFVSKNCGITDFSKETTLMQKKEATLEAIASDVYVASRKARWIPRSVIESMLKGGKMLPNR